MLRFRAWATANLRPGDAVVIETTPNVWGIYDIAAPLATRTVVAHAGAVRQIAEARVKTDTEDIKRLLRRAAKLYYQANAQLTYYASTLKNLIISCERNRIAREPQRPGAHSDRTLSHARNRQSLLRRGRRKS
jgi:hypothetical protein